MNTNLSERYNASMLLHAAGDAMGYKNGKWEFKFSSVDIHEELNELGGIDTLVLEPNKWLVSDDTVLHLAVAESLVETKNLKTSDPEVYLNLIDHYKRAMQDMRNRAPGNTCIASIASLSRSKKLGYRIPFNPKGGGCGVSMRSSVIGLRFSKPEQIQDLIEYSVESGRMTHHHPIGYLGGVATALMTSYAVQGIPIKSWGMKCLKDLSLAKNYIECSDHDPAQNIKSWNTFTTAWQNYLQIRNIENGDNEPIFPEIYDVKERDKFYKRISPFEHNWPGSNGLDSVLIAYDGLLGCKGDWRELCLRAMLHGGDNDSTGCIAGSWYGALYGFNGVHPNNYERLEYKNRLLKCAKEIYELQYGSI